MNARLWILGAPDPEMEMIESLLVSAGEPVSYASVDGTGRRVSPSTAYAPDLTFLVGPIRWVGARNPDVYLVECALPPGVEDDAAEVHVIDHHRPGDPGYGRPPAEFLSASSLGQVILVLSRLGRLPADWTPTSEFRQVGQAWTTTRPSGLEVVPPDFVFAAAADHCLGAAYRGECPGVSPDQLMAFRAASRAKHQQRPVSEVLRDVRAAQEELAAAKDLLLADVADMPHTSDHEWSRSVCDGCKHAPVYAKDMRRDTPVPELPEAATRLGIGYVSGPLVDADGRKKFTCSGTKVQIDAWYEWAEREGLEDIYGDSQRGFAGGYEPRRE